jgi:ABC-2 type transport system permease protein
MTGFAGTGQLVRLALRRDRIRLPVWLLGIAGITYVSGAAVAGLYTNQAQIDGYAALVETSPITVAFAGPPIGLDTIAGIVIYEVSFTAIVGVALMAVLTTTRHTRAEEESGRSELVRATEVGRHAGAAAALVTTAMACALLGLLLWLALLPTALTAQSAALFGAGIAVLGLVYAGVALCLAQLFVHSRTATSAGVLAFAVGYCLRAAGDVREDWLVWLSPVGWIQAVHVPTENLWWPLLLPLVASALLLGLAVALAERRDFGGGLLPSLPGRATAPPTLPGTLGLGWRVQRGAVLGWSVALLLMAMLTGGLAQSMQDMVESNPALADMLELASGGSIIDSYIATMVLILGLTVGGFAIWSTSHPGASEDQGQLELVLSGPLGRVRSMTENLLVTVATTTAVLAASALGLGIAQALVTGELSEGARAFGSQMAYLPAILTLVGVVALFAGWLPRWSWAGYLVLSFYFVIGWLGGLLDPPQWMVELSAFSHTPRVPIESAWGWELPILTLVALALMGLGVAGFRRRDLGAG